MPARSLTVPPGAAPDVAGAGAVVISVGCRDVRRRLGSTAWTVLEDLALDAHPDGAGGFWVRTSARLIAGHLGIEAGTAANALRRLRHDGFVTLSREPGPAGRFGPSVYWIAPIPGLTVADQPGPCVDSPRMVRPKPARPVSVEPEMVPPAVVEPQTVEPEVGEPAVGGPEGGSPVAAEGSSRVGRSKRVPRSEALTLWDTPSSG